MRVETLSSVGTQDMDTSGYQVSDLEDNSFHWEDPDFTTRFLPILRPGIDTPFPPSTFNDFDLCSMPENPILIDGEQDKENTPLPPTTRL